MAKTIYALLVGIDAYLGGVPWLKGCVNDVKRVREFLEERTRGGDFKLELRMLAAGDPAQTRQSLPTRENVIQGFRQHLSQAGADDVALFYYSGHGSQEKAPPEFWHLEPDHLDETLVCYDSRMPGGWDLADKELSILIAEVAQKNPHILVVLDCCHSGSGTRAAEETGVRLAPLDRRDRPPDSFLPGVAAGATAALSTGRQAQAKAEAESQKAGGWYGLPTGRHVVISACRAEESAREKIMPGGEVHGLLTYSLLDTIQRAGPTLSYRDVFSRLDTLVRNTVRHQNPVIAASEGDDLKLPFLGGAIAESRPYYNVNYEKDLGWVLQAGAIQGIAAPCGQETTHLALFPLGYAVQARDHLEKALGRARVTAVLPGKSCLTLDMKDGKQPDPEQDSFRAVVIAGPLPPVGVHLSGDDQAAIQALQEQLQQSLIVQPSREAAGASIRVMAQKDAACYYLQRAGDRRPLSVVVPNKGTPAGVTEAAAKLEHIARWLQVLQMENKQARLPAEAVAMEFFRYFPAGDGQESRSEPLDPNRLELSYDGPPDPKAALLQSRLTHTGKYPEKLYCMLVNLTEDFAISVSEALFGGGVWLDPGETQWAVNARNEAFIYMYVPRRLRDKGVVQVQDVLKLIVSTDPADANLLKQDSLDAVKDDATRGVEREARRDGVQSSSLHRLMRRVQTRAAGDLPEDEGALSDWYTRQVVVTTAISGVGAALPREAGQRTSLAANQAIGGHPAFQARVQLAGFEAGKRDIGNLALPAVFRGHPELFQPFEFQPGRGGDAGRSVIILNEVTNPETVTAQAPLVIQTGAPLGENEVVLPVAFDPESQLFLPLGLGVPTRAGAEVRIERLPGPTGDSRAVAGSIKLFFQKMLAEKFGLEGLGMDPSLTRLAAATLNEAGQVVYDDSPTTLPEKIKKARRILLLIHGFMDDTRHMVLGAHGRAGPAGEGIPRPAEHYDLILAFDYESINTPIEETATRLKKALSAAGLPAGDEKKLSIVAYSLGSQVARYLIERDEGKDLVERAILVGPPNAGTPWGTVEDFALLGLTAALNGLAAVLWPPGAIPTLVATLAGLVGGVEKIDTTLDQLKPGSSFYKVLNGSKDPNVPNPVIAGNTSRSAYQRPEHAQAEQELLKKIAGRVTSARTRDQLLSLGFFGKPNDLAVSVESMKSLPPRRAPAPLFLEAGCDHLSYFNTPEGLKLIGDALIGGQEIGR